MPRSSRWLLLGWVVQACVLGGAALLAAQNEADKKPVASEPFTLPNDDTGKLLNTVLPPRQPVGKLDAPPPAPPVVPPPTALVPSEMLPAPARDVPRLPGLKRKVPVVPVFQIPEGLDDQVGTPVPPESLSYAERPLVREDAEDVAIPPVPMVIGMALVDRIPLEDPALELSAAVVVRARPVERTVPAPFLRLTTPEPFEHRDRITVALPAEDTMPEAATPRGGPR